MGVGGAGKVCRGGGIGITQLYSIPNLFLRGHYSTLRMRD